MFNVLVRDEINSLPPPPRLVKGKTKRGSYLWKLSPVFIQKAINERIHVEQQSRGLRPFPLCHFYSASDENRASSEGEIMCCYETSIKSKTWPIGKSGLRFRNPDFGFATKRRIWKRIWALTNWFPWMFFLSFGFMGNLLKMDLKNCSQEQQSPTRTHYRIE